MLGGLLRLRVLNKLCWLLGWVCSDGGRPRGGGADDPGQRRRHTRALPGARLVDNLLARQVSHPKRTPVAVFLLRQFVLFSPGCSENPLGELFDFAVPFVPKNSFFFVANCMVARTNCHTV